MRTSTQSAMLGAKSYRRPESLCKAAIGAGCSFVKRVGVKVSTAGLPACRENKLRWGFRGGNSMDREARERYSRQILFAGIGEAGQERLLAGGAALVGCGALGTVTANLLVRAGIGHLRIIDRDFVEP